MASRPFPASATTIMSGSAATIAAMPSRSTGWVVTVRIRIWPPAFITFPLIDAGRAEKLESAQPRAARTVGSCFGDRQVNLSSGFRTAPQLQLRAHGLSAFSHSRQAPVVWAFTLSQDLGINTATIVADPQTKLLWMICDFHLHVKASGVTKSVDERLTPNQKTFLQHQGMQLPHVSFDHDLEGECIVVRGFLHHPPERCRQVAQ